jgi:hypothetical protein
VITSAGAGSAAAIAINADLLHEDVERAAFDLDADIASTIHHTRQIEASQTNSTPSR